MRRSRPSLASAGVLAALLLSGLVACATTGTQTGTAAGGIVPGTANVAGDMTWPTSTREHIDLWLHGYALLPSDTARVPFFRSGYRQRMRALKNQGNVYSQLDANFDGLSSRFVANPSLVNGQFVPFYFSSFEQMQQVTSAFLQSGGDPRAAGDQTTQQLFNVLAGAFPNPADRDWLRLFVQSLADENNRFYQEYWSSQQRERASVRQAVDSLWQRSVRPRIQRF